MVRFALDLHLLNSKNSTDIFVTVKGDCLSDIFKNIVFSMDEVKYSRVWYIEQSIAELEEHGEGWWNWFKQWYLTKDELNKLMWDTLYARN